MVSWIAGRNYALKTMMDSSHYPFMFTVLLSDNHYPASSVYLVTITHRTLFHTPNNEIKVL